MPDAPSPAAPVAAPPAAAPAPAPVSTDPAAVAVPAAPAALEKTPEEKATAARFAELARRESALGRERASVRAQAAEAASLREEVKALKAAQAAAKTDPLGAMKSLGLSYEEVTQYILNDNKPTASLEVRGVREELEKLRTSLAEEKKAAAEAEKASLLGQQERVLAEFREATTAFVDAHPDDYELTRLYGAHGAVVDLIAQRYESSVAEGKPVLLSQKEAADLVEAELLERARKIASAKKLQPVPAAPASAKPPSASPKTVSNAMSPATAPGTPALTEKERIRRAMARLNGETP